MTIRAIAGVILFNAALVGAGAAIVWGLGAYRLWVDVVRLVGLGYLVALAALMSILSLELVLGVAVTATSIALSLVGLATAGLGAGVLRGVSPPTHGSAGWRVPRISLFVAVCLAGVVVYFEGLFRQARLSTIVLDWDGWAFWVPKAKAIYYFGRLDPEFLAFLPNQSYPPGLPAVHAAVFHFMGSADDGTLHLQYWFYAVGFVAALVGVLESRVRPAILVPLLFLILLAPSFVIRFTWTYADVPLGVLVATAALLVVLWVDERQPWQLTSAVILLAGAALTKREGLVLAACVLAAGGAASAREWRRSWPRLAVAGGIVLMLSVPWRVWFMSHGLPDDAPSAGVVGGLDDLQRGWATVKLVITTLVEPDFWLVTPFVCAAAVLLALLARAWASSVAACTFVAAAAAFGIWVIWSEPGLPISTNDALNPVVRLTGTSILVLAALTPLLLERAWARPNERGGEGCPPTVGPDFFVWRSRGAWSVVGAVALAYPASMLVGYSGQTLPGGPPHFPSPADCVGSHVPGEKVRVVVGYAESYPEALELRRQAKTAGIGSAHVAQDGCGRLRVSVGDLPSTAAAHALLLRAEAAGLDASIESDVID